MPIHQTQEIAIIGAGPAGLAAAEILVANGLHPTIYEAKPSPARKFLMAGKSGLNLTKNEPSDRFMDAIATDAMRPSLAEFGPAAAIEWAEALGEPLFTGSSGRVFPKAMKASPLLRKWLARLAEGGATLRTRWRWAGFDGPALAFETPQGAQTIRPDAVVLALGGASWPALGSDAAWVPWLADRGVNIAPFRPANMGFEYDWSEHFMSRFAGAPVKSVGLRTGETTIKGEFVISAYGVEGSAIYALSASLRDGDGPLYLDLLPDLPVAEIAKRLSRPRGKNSRANFLRKSIGLTGVKAGLLHELTRANTDPLMLAEQIKALPITLSQPRPIAEAISSAGGIDWPSLDEHLMLRTLPGHFAAGEMLNWEAPTGGYLITGCIASGRQAGQGALDWLFGEAKKP